MTPVEEIKQRIDIVDLIQEYIKVQPAGMNFKATCPFHNEKTPSFMISPDKQIWHCFGCGTGGDHFEFIKRIEGVEFPEALRILAKRANVVLEYVNPELHNQKTKLLDLLKDLANYYHQVLLNNSSAQFVREYLKNRNITDDTIGTYQLGYAPDSWHEAIDYLQEKKYTLREIEQAGVSKQGEKNKPYDRFRNRLIFPIRDIHGNVVGFTGRVMATEYDGGKYINSPTSPIYNKSNILYNLDLAKQEIRKKDYAILVEGNMDAISAYQVNTRNVIAVSGTSLTDDQIKLIKRFTQNVMIAFDADVAGTQANLRGIDLMWQAGLNVKVVHLPEDLDPDDLIRSDVEKWKELLRTAENFMDYIFKVTLNELDLSRVDHKKQAAQKLLKVISKLGDPVEESHYLKKLADILKVSEEALSKKIEQFKDKVKPQIEEKKIITGKVVVTQEQAIAERLLALLLKYPDNLEIISKRLNVGEVLYLPVQKLYKELIIYYNNKHNFDHNEFSNTLENNEKDYLNQLSLLAEDEISEETKTEIQREIIVLTKRIKEYYTKKRLKELEFEIKKAQDENNKEEMNRLSQEFTKLSSELNDF